MRSARRIVKSRSGLAGTEDGSVTSPGWRAPGGGIDTTISAKSSPCPLDPPNMTPGGSRTGARVVATRRSTWLASGALGPTTRVPYGRLEQPAAVPHSAIIQMTPIWGRAAVLLSGARSQSHNQSPSPTTRCLVELREGWSGHRVQGELDRGRQEARFRRLCGLLVLGNEPPDRQQHDNDDQDDRPHREAARGRRSDRSCNPRRGGLGAPRSGFSGPRCRTGGGTRCRSDGGCGARDRRRRGWGRAGGRGTETGQKSRSPKHFREFGGKRGRDRALLTVQHRKNRGRIGPV